MPTTPLKSNEVRPAPNYQIKAPMTEPSTAINEAFHKTPYAYPPKRWLLYLLNLPDNATQAEYEAAFQKVCGPFIQNGAKEVFQNIVQKFKDKGLSYDEAWSAAKSDKFGRRLYEEWTAKSKIKP